MSKYFKKVNDGVGFARKEEYEYQGTKYEADIKDGDVITILDSGNKEMGKFGEQDNFKIKTRNGEKKLALNQTTINILVEELGDESENWVGKQVKVLIVKKMIAGEKATVPYLAVDGWKIDEYGEPVKILTGLDGEEVSLDPFGENHR